MELMNRTRISTIMIFFCFIFFVLVKFDALVAALPLSD